MPERSPAAEFAYLSRLKPKEAIDYLAGRKLITPTFSWQDLWHNEHAQQFTVSRLARLDLLKAMQDGISQSVGGDLSRRDWTRNIKTLLQKEGWWGEKEVLDPVSGETVITKFNPPRLKLIFDTNTRMAYSAGLWERIERNKETHPYVRYITRRDERVRASHRDWNNLCLPVDHPFWHTHWPPNGWHCRCRVMSITAAEYERRRAAGSIETQAPRIVTREWVNKRTGEVSQVPVGIDPGFDYNVGVARARAANLAGIGRDKIAGLPAPLQKAALAPTVGEGVSPAFADAVTKAHAALPAATRQALAGAGYEVRIVDRIVRAAPELAGKTVPGYARRQAYEQVDGLTRYTQRQILVAEQALDAVSQEWQAATPARGSAVLQHETGHALDQIYQLAETPAVAAAWRKEAAALAAYQATGNTDFAGEIDDFIQAWPRGLLETVAELYALRHGPGTASFLNVGAAFPEMLAALTSLFDDRGL